MKTGLRLTADQEKDWGSFETAVKDGAKARLLALQKEQGNNLSPMDRLTAKAERLAQSKASLHKMVETAKPLYASLNEGQKRTFITLGRMLVPERGTSCEGDAASGRRRGRLERVAFGWDRHCEERSDEAIQRTRDAQRSLDCFPSGSTRGSQ